MIIAIFSALIQAAEIYLRRLSFSPSMTDEENSRLRLRIFLFGAVMVVLYQFIFANFGINALTYKSILMLGLIPWIILFVSTVRRSASRHLFVVGMSAMWSLCLHSVSASIILLTLDLHSDSEIILAEASTWLILFVILFPIERYCFIKLLPPTDFFERSPQAIYLAAFPLVIISGQMIRLIDNDLLQPWPERISRIYLPLVFFFMFRYIVTAAKNFYNLQRLTRHRLNLQDELNSLKEYNELIRQNQEKVSVMRHDLRHSYNLIYALIDSGNIAKAREHIITQEFLLETTAMQTFCQSPAINAALTIYLKRAEEAGVQVFQRINLPSKLETNETDFALLLVNLFENALIACKKQPTDSREMSIIIQHGNGQCVVEISFRSKTPLPLDEDGLLMTFDEEKIGVANSLREFVKKYDAYSGFTHIDDRVNLFMYWKDGDT